MPSHLFLDYADFQSLRPSSLASLRFFPSLGLWDGKTPERVWGELVRGNYCSLLGIQAIHGRMLMPDEGRAPGAYPVGVGEGWKMGPGDRPTA